MVSGPHFLGELVRRIDGRVDLAAKILLRLRQRRNHSAERGLPHNDDIDVASRLLATGGHGAVNEGYRDALGERGQSFAKNVRHTACLDRYGLQLRENRQLGIGLVVDLIALAGAYQHSRLRPAPQLALDRALPDARHADNLAQIEGLLRTGEEDGQQRALRFPEQDRNWTNCTHYECVSTLFGCVRQAWARARAARFRTVCTGRRFGKTLCLAAELLDRGGCDPPSPAGGYGAAGRGRDYGWVAPTYNVAERGIEAFRTIAEGFVRVVGRMPTRVEFEGSAGPVRVWFLSADNADNIRGYGFQGLVIDEAASVPRDVWHFVLEELGVSP